jgi:hypothetical protein
MRQLLVAGMREVTMKWPLRKRPVNLTRDKDALELKESKGQLKQVRSRWPEINSLVSRLGNLNEENHYADIITEAIQGGKR